jgi:hypothetical protein
MKTTSPMNTTQTKEENARTRIAPAPQVAGQDILGRVVDDAEAAVAREKAEAEHAARLERERKERAAAVAAAMPTPRNQD